jgi:hypothetical protein
MPPTLKLYLLSHYSYADRRVKNPASPAALQVDDREPYDKFHHFCYIFVTVPDPTQDDFQLILSNAPDDPTIQSLVLQQKDSTYAPLQYGRALIEIPLRATAATTTTYLWKLARAFRHLIRPPQSYPDPNWCWVVPRTAGSLVRLASRLADYRSLCKAAREP